MWSQLYWMLISFILQKLYHKLLPQRYNQHLCVLQYLSLRHLSQCLILQQLHTWLLCFKWNMCLNWIQQLYCLCWRSRTNYRMSDMPARILCPLQQLLSVRRMLVVFLAIPVPIQVLQQRNSIQLCLPRSSLAYRNTNVVDHFPFGPFIGDLTHKMPKNAKKWYYPHIDVQNKYMIKGIPSKESQSHLSWSVTYSALDKLPIGTFGLIFPEDMLGTAVFFPPSLLPTISAILFASLKAYISGVTLARLRSVEPRCALLSLEKLFSKYSWSPWQLYPPFLSWILGCHES